MSRWVTNSDKPAIKWHVLMEQLSSLPVKTVGLMGYTQTERFLWSRNTVQVAVETNKGTTTLAALPGDVYIEPSRILTEEEKLQINAIIASHNTTTVSKEESNWNTQQTDRADLRALAASGANLSQEDVKKLLRYVMRRVG